MPNQLIFVTYELGWGGKQQPSNLHSLRACDAWCCAENRMHARDRGDG